MSSNKYDIIIAGGGLSGLSLAWYLAKGGYQGEVLIAPLNQKTWCFWNKGKPPFQEIIYHKWRKSFVSVLDFDSFLYMHEYAYYCIRESDFKEYVLTELKKFKNFHLLEESILDFSSNNKKAALVTKASDTYLADYIFQSIFKPNIDEKQKAKYPLIQHFLGYEIKTHFPVFDPETFVIMDFDEEFDEGVAFMYVLPFRQNTALVEFTVFSETPLKKKEYRKKIKAYLKKKYNLDREDYDIRRKEYGEIPMDDTKHPQLYASKIINIGTVGGQTKPSTGYTFIRVQNYSKQLAESIIKRQDPELPKLSEARYRYYDLLLLHILSNSKDESLKVFRDLYRNNSIDQIFAFLSEETTLLQDLKIMSSVPYIPFFKAIGKNL